MMGKINCFLTLNDFGSNFYGLNEEDLESELHKLC